MTNYLQKTKVFRFGSNLSTILGNMTLDELQKRLYDLQGDTIKDYFNGYCIRFADDEVTMARTEKDAIKFKDKIEKFIRARGLKLSENKTKIVHIKDGFEFLSRYYCKVDGGIRCIPSEKAVKNFEKEVEESMETFKHLDVIINALLLKYMKQIYKNSSKEQLIKKYWKVDSFGRNVFCLPSNNDKYLKIWLILYLLQI